MITCFSCLYRCYFEMRSNTCCKRRTHRKHCRHLSLLRSVNLLVTTDDRRDGSNDSLSAAVKAIVGYSRHKTLSLLTCDFIHVYKHTIFSSHVFHCFPLKLLDSGLSQAERVTALCALWPPMPQIWPMSDDSDDPTIRKVSLSFTTVIRPTVAPKLAPVDDPRALL